MDRKLHLGETALGEDPLYPLTHLGMLPLFEPFFANCEVDIHQGILPLLFIFVSYVFAMDPFDSTTQLETSKYCDIAHTK